MTTAPLASLMADDQTSLDPRLSHHQTFELWSIPAYDKGQPEILSGAEIGSAKKVVQAGDVLLSRIVPHIRRVLIVGPRNRHVQIASTEWLVFRGGGFTPAYLRQFLLSDKFHSQFMKTVAGVGGSLLRARPAEVGRIEVPLPQPTEQRRIAAILDQADSLGSKRIRIASRYNALKHSIFEAMFKYSTQSTLAELCELITDGTHYTPIYEDSGVPFLSAKNVTQETIDWTKTKFIGRDLHKELSRRVRPRRDDVLLAKNGTTGIAALVDSDIEFDIYVSLALLRPKSLLPEFLLYAVNSARARRQFHMALKGIGVHNLHLEDIRRTRVPAPPDREQRIFVKRLEAIDVVATSARAAAERSAKLSRSLQAQFFGGTPS